MHRLNVEVQQFITELSQIRDTRSFATAFELLVNKFGFKFFVVSGIPDEYTSIEEMLVAHNLPETWVSEYINNNYVSNDPIVAKCMRSREPFFWRQAIDTTTSVESINIIKRAEGYGLTNGVCVPIHNINGFEAGVSLSGSETPLPKNQFQYLYLASIMAFNTLRNIRSEHSLRVEAISEREREVLTWCALGKISKEIAYILFVSENTINVHVKNAISKLSANNKTEAVAIAIRKGIISV
jgi:LuxR family quorum sensing-dependent transcriptional regulator